GGDLPSHLLEAQTGLQGVVDVPLPDCDELDGAPEDQAVDAAVDHQLAQCEPDPVHQAGSHG
ncbi:hypothetical protein, partial [Providencia stuartii]|uniref:hypothetical protein n=1 Tax=Providencia stuartii TaxID=588 RepID=UPI0013D0C30B